MTSGSRQSFGCRPAAALPARLRARPIRGQDGFLLVEVMISAMLVAIIVSATFNGLDVATRITSDERHHDEAALLAAQSQEQLRTEPASALDALETSPHKYTTKIGGTTFTITQEARAVSASGTTTGCNATEAAAHTGANILIASRVSWPQQAAAKRPEVKQASVITPPVGSALEVDVLNGEGTGVSGVTARAEFIPNEAGSYNTVEGTTGSAGCVVLTGIQSTSAKVEIVEKAGFVTPSGALKIASKELSIAPNVTTHYQVRYAEAGRIAAEYTYNNATSYEGKTVKGDSFVASNVETGIKPEYETGAGSFEYKTTGAEASEEFYRALTGTYSAISYTAAGAKYSLGRLFPFKGAWTVYAGDCPANNVSKEDEAGGAFVKSGSPVAVKVPLSYTKLSIYTGAAPTYEPGELTKESSKGPVKITNTSCAGAEEALNAYSPIYTHEQKETLTEGRLENPFMPFGSFQICVAWKKEKAYTLSVTNSKASGSTPVIYLKQRTAAERTAEIAAESTAKAKREKEETEAETAKKTRETEEAAATAAKKGRETAEVEAAAAKTKREKEETEMATARKARETKEAEERAAWLKEESEKKINKSTREAKEKAQKTARLAKEAEEASAKSARETAEAAAATAKKTREAEEAAAGAAKKAREEAETAATAAKEARKTEETAAAAAKKAREAREAAEAASGVTVESRSSCP